MADLKAFAEQLVNLTVKEVQELATILKDELRNWREQETEKLKDKVAHGIEKRKLDKNK